MPPNYNWLFQLADISDASPCVPHAKLSRRPRVSSASVHLSPSAGPPQRARERRERMRRLERERENQSRDCLSTHTSSRRRKKEPSQFRFECAQCVCAEGMTSMYKGAPEQQQLVRVDHQDGIAPGPSSSSQQQLLGRDANPLDAAVGKLLDGELSLHANCEFLRSFG